jgi:hypothetical protein
MPAPQIDRLVVSRGPALVTFNGGYFLSKEDIVVDLSKESKEIPSSAFGKLWDINVARKCSTKMTPVGEFEHLDVLWPYGSTMPGTSIFGAADTPLLIQPLDVEQEQCEFFAAGISKMPDIVLAATETLLGEVEFQMIGENDTPVDDAASLFQFDTNVLDPDTIPFDDTKVLTQAYVMSWGSSPWDSFRTREGIKVAFNMQITEDKADGIGHYDSIFRSLAVSAKAMPAGVSQSDVLTAMEIQGANSVQGKRITGTDLIVTGDGLYFIMYGAGIKTGGLVFSAEKQRVPELEWLASRSVVGGVINPLFYIGTAAPGS